MNRVPSFIQGHKLFVRPDGSYEDEYGSLYDYRHGKLFREQRPGVWYLVRDMRPIEPRRMPAVQRGVSVEF